MMINEKMAWALQALAQPSEQQLNLFPDFANAADELALSWEEVIEDEDLSGLSESQKKALSVLDEYIVSISGKKNAHLWTNEALKNNIEWSKIRALASAAIEELGWQKVNLKPSKWAIYVDSNQAD
ncbi:hypothetical protein [Aliikangiella maris]|uniref:Uncharacterized protein n=2 Tax=Aliikangiella maris TaxID=3162458 RepID=A0ABV3MVD5_9GAMM